MPFNWGSLASSDNNGVSVLLTAAAGCCGMLHPAQGSLSCSVLQKVDKELSWGVICSWADLIWRFNEFCVPSTRIVAYSFLVNPGVVFPVSDISNPGQVLLKNLTQMSTGLYQCIATNEAGQESCVVQVTVQREYWHITNILPTTWAVQLLSCPISADELCHTFALLYLNHMQQFLLRFCFAQQSL